MQINFVWMKASELNVLSPSGRLCVLLFKGYQMQKIDFIYLLLCQTLLSFEEGSGTHGCEETGAASIL